MLNRNIYRGTETVLLVEDEDQVKEIIRNVLIGYGYNVIDSSGGDEAFEKAENYKGQIHILITDIMMPDINGKELAEKIIAIRPELKVLFMSGYTDSSIVQNGVLESGISFINKPFDIPDFLKKLREILD